MTPPRTQDGAARPAFVLLIALVALFLLALATNPSGERHRARIEAALEERSPLVAMFGGNKLVAMAATYHSLGVASYTELDDRKLSFGVFGMVFILPE